MTKLYFMLMKLFKKRPTSRVYQWAYMRCLRAYMAEDPVSGYWLFAEDFFAIGV